MKIFLDLTKKSKNVGLADTLKRTIDCIMHEYKLK